MDDDEDDTHICLACQQTIVGLDSYVKHRKQDCPAKKGANLGKAPLNTSKLLTPSSVVTIALPTNRGNSSVLNVGNNMIPLTDSGFSPPGNLGIYTHVQEPVCTTVVGNTVAGSYLCSNTAVTSTDASNNMSEPTADHAMFSDFFSSLELQSRTPSQHPKPTSPEKIQSPDPFHGDNDLESFDQAKQFFDNSKTLKIASILNELDISSDSEGFNEDFLNFSDMDEELDVSVPARPRLYGKWKPGMQHYPGKHSPGKGKHRPGGKGESHHKHVGKIENTNKDHKDETSNTPGRHRGKLDVFKDHAASSNEPDNVSDQQSTSKVEKSPRGHVGKLEAYKRHHKVDKLTAYKRSMEAGDDAQSEISSEDEQDQSRQRTRRSARFIVSSRGSEIKDVTTGKGRSKKTETEMPAAYKCNPCGRDFVSKASFERHLTSTLHKKRCFSSSIHKTSQKGNKLPSINCPICDKEFYNKFTFARHLVSPSHMKRILPDGERESKEKSFLNEGMQMLLLRLKSFQCRVCGFYCHDKEPFLDHLKTALHTTKCAALLGPLKCSTCKFTSRNSGAMFDHFSTSPAHGTIEKNGRPSVLREQRNNIPCEICGKVIHSIMQFKIHMKVKHQEKPVRKRKGRTKPSCTYCGTVCGSAFALTIHIRRKHTKERPHKCDFCNVAFADKSTLNLHKRSQKHVDKLVDLSENPLHKSTFSEDGVAQFRNIRSYKCDHCFYRTADHAKLRPHYLQAHTMNIFNCDICGTTFLKERIYESHLKSAAHLRKSALAEKDGHKMFTCTSCSQKFYDERSFKVHEIIHKSARPDEKNLSAVLEDLDVKFHEFVKNFQFDDENMHTRFQCPECKKRLSQNKLLMHLRMHSNKDPYQCLFCKKGWKDRMILIRHLETHLDTKKISCQYCDKEFLRKKSLNRHITQKHREKAGLAEIPTFACQHCGKKFCDKGTFNMHLLTHEEKKVKCPYAGCRLAFRLESELNLHYRTHTGERPFLCDICGYGGKTRNQLNRHRRVHTQERNYHCQYCTYKASNSTNLRRHMRIHIGSKPYRCPYCSHRANCVENIRKHILKTKQHAGMYIYPCRDCKFGTNSAKEIREHLIETHGMDPNSVGISSIFTGLYEKESDVSAVPEGGLVHPVRDPACRQPKDPSRPKTKRQRVKSRAKNIPANSDHAYVHNPVKLGELESEVPPIVIDPSKLVYRQEPATITVEGVGEVQCYVQEDGTPLPCFDVQVEYVTECQDVVEETVVTHNVLEELMPLNSS